MKKNIYVVFLVIINLVSFPVKDFALDSPTAIDPGLFAKESGVIKLYMGQSRLIAVNNPTRIAIGDPAIADVIKVTKEEITLVPKSAGKTTLAFWDIYGEQSYIIKVFNDDLNDIKKRIEGVLAKAEIAGIKTKIEEDEGKVFLLGQVKTTQDRDRLNLALGSLKDKTVDLITVRAEESVIEIDVQVLELDKGATQELGFTWPSSINISEIGSPGLATNTPTQVGGTDTVTDLITGGTTWGQLFKVSRVTRDAFNLKIDFLMQEGRARILSRPRLSCLSGKEAKLLVGGEVPVLSSTLSMGGSTGTGGPAATPGNVEYKEYGITLKIKPVIEASRRIHLNLGMEVSELGDEVKTDYALAYTFNKRNASTELYLDDGETMAIGGLIKQKTEESIRKVPWLGDLPMIGAFFRYKKTSAGGGSDNKTDTELFITLTPHIVSEPKDLTEEKETALPQQEPAALKAETQLDPVTRYARLIQERIQDRLAYPEQAKNASVQGVARLTLRLSYLGELLEARIKESSGHPVLDDNALLTAKRLAPYPPFPPAIEGKELFIEIPITYKMN